MQTKDIMNFCHKGRDVFMVRIKGEEYIVRVMGLIASNRFEVCFKDTKEKAYLPPNAIKDVCPQSVADEW